MIVMQPHQLNTHFTLTRVCDPWSHLYVIFHHDDVICYCSFAMIVMQPRQLNTHFTLDTCM